MENRIDMLGLLPKNMIMCELGVFLGDFAEKMLTICEPKELHLVDMWSGNHLSATDENGENMLEIKDMYVTYESVVKRFMKNRNVYIHRGLTTLLNVFDDNYFDFIYIDACHEYKSVKIDLDVAYRKSKKYISGHDYYNGCRDVQRAVNEFASEKSLSISKTKNKISSFLMEIKK